MLRHREDVVPLLIVAIALSAQLLGLLWKPHLALLVVLLAAMRWVALVQHNHVHVPTLRSKVSAHALGAACSVMTGVPTSLYWFHHVVVHHRLNCQPADWTGPFSYPGSSFPGRPVARWRYVLTFIPRAIARCPKGLWREHPGRRGAMLVDVVAVLGVLLAGIAAVGAGLLPAESLALFVLLPWLGMFAALPLANWRHHVGCDFADELTSAKVNRSPLSAGPLGLNIGYHTAHHMAPGLHWSKLEHFHAAHCAGRIPEAYYASVPLLATFSRRLRGWPLPGEVEGIAVGPSAPVASTPLLGDLDIASRWPHLQRYVEHHRTLRAGDFDLRPEDVTDHRVLHVLHAAQSVEADTPYQYLKVDAMGFSRRRGDMRLFFDQWLDDERSHAACLDALLRVHPDVERPAHLPHMQAGEIGSLRKSGFRAIGRLDASLVAFNALGAGAEFVTNHVYLMVGAQMRGDSAALLTELARQERQHMMFYLGAAQATTLSKPGVRLARSFLERYWVPVGVDFLGIDAWLEAFGDMLASPEAIDRMTRMDRLIDTIPGLAGLDLMARFLDDHSLV